MTRTSGNSNIQRWFRRVLCTDAFLMGFVRDSIWFLGTLRSAFWYIRLRLIHNAASLLRMVVVFE